jgi:hypothetical protein
VACANAPLVTATAANAVHMFIKLLKIGFIFFKRFNNIGKNTPHIAAIQ